MLVLVALLAFCSRASAAHPDPEAKLRAFESRTLGAAHAAEHELARRAAGEAATAAPEPATATGLAAEPADVGRWAPKFSIPSVAVHAVMLPTGKILYFTGPTIAQAHLLDPVTHAVERVDPPALPGQRDPANIFCAGQSLLPDGRVLIVGGTVERRVGLNTIFIFDPFTKAWTRQPNMRHGRWYPSQVLLADGRTAILDGLDERGEPFVNPDLELFDMAAGTVALASVRGTAGQPPMGGLYPHLFAMPTGRVLVAGPERRDSWFFGFGSGGTFAWEEAPDLLGRHTWGTGVLLPGGPEGSTRVALIGGADKDALPDSGTSTPLTSTETFDEQSSSAGWAAGPSLNVGRAHHNTVLLPDGSMVTVGGGYGILNGNRRTGNSSHLQIELFDPVSGTWRLGPPQEELRTYHSTALLLPDGRVLSAGDDVNGGTDTDTAEIYEPAYLFKSARPVIDSAPAAAGYGATFTVETRDSIARAVLIAPGAVTHANDMSQRHVSLEMVRRADGRGVDLTAPANARIAPPGYYMLFLLDEQGVPSMARFVRLMAAPPPPVIAAQPETVLSGEEVTLTASPGAGAGSIAAVAWDLDADGTFDDGNANPVHRAFASPGQHTVRVRVTYTSGLSAIAERALTIGNRAPSAVVGFAPSVPLSLESVTFTVTATDSDGTITARQWDLDGDGFDDGDGPMVARTFPRKGDYAVRVLVTDDSNATVVASATVSIANRPPLSSFWHTPADAVPLQTVTFTSTSSDADGTVASLEWDTDDDGSFDDGTGPTTSRAFPEAGSYAVGLRVLDNDGAVSIASKTVEIRTESSDVPPPAPPLDLASPPAPALGPVSGSTGNAAPAVTLTRARAKSAARRALQRRYGRRYGRSSRKRLSCKRQAAGFFSCRYSFRDRGSRRKGTIAVRLEGATVTARFGS